MEALTYNSERRKNNFKISTWTTLIHFFIILHLLLFIKSVTVFKQHLKSSHSIRNNRTKPYSQLKYFLHCLCCLISYNSLLSSPHSDHTGFQCSLNMSVQLLSQGLYPFSFLCLNNFLPMLRAGSLTSLILLIQMTDFLFSFRKQMYFLLKCTSCSILCYF